MSFQTIKVRFQDPVCFLQFDRPEANNTINDLLIRECSQALALCEEKITIVVLEGLPDVFCFGADFREIRAGLSAGRQSENDPEPVYDLWMKVAFGPFITISHVRGKTNAGGVGFVAASDMVIADQSAQFSLSELLFGLFPACVLPFLIRRVGFQKAHYLTLMTHPISVEQAYSWGLVDAYENQSEALLRKHLLRLRRLSKAGITRYKRFMQELYHSIQQSKPMAVAANRQLFSDSRNLDGIVRYVEKGKFPWED